VEGSSAFAVSGGESAEVFEPVEAAFDAVAELVESAVVRSLHFAADLRRDDGFGADAFDGGDDRVGVVAPVGHDDIGSATG
jgi:hypothetical protein